MVFIRKSMSYVNEMIVMKKYNDACLLLEKIKKYQQKECDGLLPADNKFKAEKIYNQFDYSKSVAMACICIGLICFIYYCHCMASQKRTSRKAIIILNILLWIVFYLFVGCYLPAWLCEQSSAIVQRLRNHAVHGMVYAIAHFSATT